MMGAALSKLSAPFRILIPTYLQLEVGEGEGRGQGKAAFSKNYLFSAIVIIGG